MESYPRNPKSFPDFDPFKSDYRTIKIEKFQFLPILHFFFLPHTSLSIGKSFEVEYFSFYFIVTLKLRHSFYSIWIRLTHVDLLLCFFSVSFVVLKKFHVTRNSLAQVAKINRHFESQQVNDRMFRIKNSTFRWANNRKEKNKQISLKLENKVDVDYLRVFRNENLCEILFKLKWWQLFSFTAPSSSISLLSPLIGIWYC